MQYWSEKFDQVPTFNPGEQSKVYPNAFPGLVYPTDPGIPNTLVPQKFRFAPRFGLAYSPNKSDGLLGKILGGPGSTSIRAGYAMLNTIIEGNSIGVDEPQPPYGLSGTVFNGLFVSPYNLADGTIRMLRRIRLPSRRSMPRPAIRIPSLFVNIYNPQSGMTAPTPWNTYPYAEDYFLSFERQLPRQTVLSISYVGSQAHHLPLVYSANPGNPALCLALNQPGVLAAGESCGPGGENTTYNLAQPFTFGGITYPAGTVLQGTRVGLEPDPGQQQRDVGKLLWERRLRGEHRKLELQCAASHREKPHQGPDLFPWLHLQQVHRPSLVPLRCRRSFQFQPHARPFGLESDAQLCGNLRLPAAAGASVTSRSSCAGGLGNFRRHSCRHRLPGHSEHEWR